MNNIRIALLLLSSLVGSALRAQYNGQIPNNWYLEIGAGSTVYHNSHISDATLQRWPLHLYIEAGKFMERFSIAAGYDFNTSYGISDYRLNPNFAFLQLRGDLIRRTYRPFDLSLFALAGPVYQKTVLRLQTENMGLDQEERAEGPGYMVGLGVRAERNRWALGVTGTLIRAHVNFTGGGFEPIPYQTGSERVTLTLGYKLKTLEDYASKCPTFR